MGFCGGKKKTTSVFTPPILGVSNMMVKRKFLDKSSVMASYAANGFNIEKCAAALGVTPPSMLTRVKGINRALFEGYENGNTPEEDRVYLPVPEGGKRGRKAGASPAALAALVKQLVAPPTPPKE